MKQEVKIALTAKSGYSDLERVNRRVREVTKAFRTSSHPMGTHFSCRSRAEGTSRSCLSFPPTTHPSASHSITMLTSCRSALLRSCRKSQARTARSVGGAVMASSALPGSSLPSSSSFVPSSLHSNERRMYTTHSQLPEEHRMVYDTCRNFADVELAPNAGKWDKHHEFPLKAITELVRFLREKNGEDFAASRRRPPMMVARPMEPTTNGCSFPWPILSSPCNRSLRLVFLSQLPFFAVCSSLSGQFGFHGDEYKFGMGWC